jgi:two-component system chemotaxis response regulator CheB
LNAVVCVVQHIGRYRSALPELLSAAGGMPARHAEDGMALQARAIYIAPPDHHLIVRPGRLRLSRGPRENRTRPAIDPLFRSAAACYGPDVIGAVLTGWLNDGVAGLLAIKDRGGIAVVQDPASARAPDMPRNALKHVPVDYCVALPDIAPLLTRLVFEASAGDGDTKLAAPDGAQG